ncbi:hypothetical protein Hypma_007152 [Hypsizygus marmoreus]|uniref:Ubiquitin 3 binding protein But2 C-terminal domain-containing protein n=1 Tax=Hypsizygus marmoreus TaxID=39966 RepID=A0A369KEM2_HYPMA|nr:hypothetical protein Hypma_007152 [Hypsizygus marmoreus]
MPGPPNTDNRRQYRQVSVDEDDLVLSKTGSMSSTPAGLYQRNVLWLCLACTAVNVLTLLINFRRPFAFENSPILDRQDIHRLRRPSQYIGFDDIRRPSPPIARNFTTFPFTVAQIDAAEPQKVFDPDLKRYMALSGTVYPDEKRVVVANKITTVIQFRAIDYGMETCDIHINLLPASEPSVHFEGVSIYRLESAAPLDLRILSHRTSPKRVGKLADIHAMAGQATHWHHRLSCSLEEVLTFELACPSDVPIGMTCNLEWWQGKEESSPGVYIVQHATV